MVLKYDKTDNSKFIMLTMHDLRMTCSFDILTVNGTAILEAFDI